MVFMMTFDIGAVAHPFIPQPACGTEGWWGSISGPDSDCWQWQWANDNSVNEQGIVLGNFGWLTNKHFIPHLNADATKDFST